jgi:phage I-like protein
MKDVIGYRILNRSGKLPEDGWYHIAPEGVFPHPTGVKQVIDRQANEAMVNSFREDKAKLGDHFPGLLVDFDHFSNDPKAPSEAAGWIDDVQNRVDQEDPKDNGLWAKIEWSDTGKGAVEGKRYRLVSPVWNRKDCEELGGDRIRPLRLDRIALTNDPNLKGMNPLTNRDEPKETTVKTDDETDSTSTRQAAQVPKFLLNYGTSEGAKKGWLTRRGGAGARMATKSDLKAKRSVVKSPLPTDAEHAANEAKLSPKRRYQLREEAKDDTSSTGAAMRTRYRQLVAKEVAKQSAPPPPAPAPPAPIKGGLKVVLPPRRMATKDDLDSLSKRRKLKDVSRRVAATKADLAVRTSGYDSTKAAAFQGGADSQAFMQRRAATV